MKDEDIFANAIALPSSDRESFIQSVCERDTGRVRRLLALIECYEATDSMRAVPETASADVASDGLVGQSIGPYRLREIIDEGGMGTVFVAEQDQPVRRKVALKVIKAGLDTKSMLARFEAERQALALMEHPNIARVLDAGSTNAGRPYFVMELVRGIPVTSYCDEKKLPLRDRLELFVSVCKAIQHAHQKGIIHRDIKPSNVLVTEHDGEPVVKVIDFGVAKAIGQKLTDRSIYTSHMQPVGTLQYMSPEQSRLSGLDIDTRSDVYSLGLLLYEMLTGLLPFDRETFNSADFDEKRRIIAEDEALKPSTRVSSSLPGSNGLRLELTTFSKQLKGELDWIVLKALEKDRNRRYDTPDRLAEDVERYLCGDVVLARPASLGYRVSKSWKRNRGLFSAAAAILLLLSVSLSTISYLYVQQSVSQNKLREIVREYKRSLLDSALSFALSGQRARADKLIRDVERILPEIHESEYYPGTIRKTIDGVYSFYHGDMEGARKSLEEVIDKDPGNVVAQTVHVRSLLNTGDWPRFLEELPRLSNLEVDSSFHERLFFSHAQLLIDNDEAIKQLNELLVQYPGNAYALSTLALALHSKAMDTNDPDLIRQAIEKAEHAKSNGEMTPLTALALVSTHFDSRRLLKDVEASKKNVAKAIVYLEELERYPNYMPGILVRAQVLNSSPDHQEDAKRLFSITPFTDFPAAVFCQDEEYEVLDSLRQNWKGDVPFVVETRDGLTCSNRNFFNLSGKRARRE